MSGTGVCVAPAAGTLQTVTGDPGRVRGTRVKGLTDNADGGKVVFTARNESVDR